MAGTSINDQILNSLKSLTTNHSTSDKMKADINLQTTDWLELLVAQLKNQDMNNTMDTGEMMSQMAQFSQIQSIQNMVSMQESIHAMDVTSYAASLMGKEVTVAEMTTTTNSKGEKEDVLVTKKGIVEGVALFQGEPIVYIDKKPYALSQIMLIGNVPDNPADKKPIAGDKDGNGVIEGDEILGDKDGNGIIDGDEVEGDRNGDGVVDDKDKVEGDTNGDGVVNDKDKIEGDTNGDGVVDDKDKVEAGGEGDKS